jgi:Domain of unknown function (DUF4386)
VKATARTAGLLYLIVVLTGIFSIAYLPSQLIVRGDAAATFAHISANSPLLRLGIAAGFVCYIAYTMLPLVLYKLLESVNKKAAVLMVVFALIGVTISFVNLFHRLDLLSLTNQSPYLSAFTLEQLQAMVMLCLDAYRHGIVVCEIFWGLWLLPFGYLVYRSGFLPKTLGVLLMLGCFGYLIEVFASTIFPAFNTFRYAGFVTLPASIGEIGTCLWLLIIGVRESKRSILSTRSP